jgi:hypothetical protein
MTRYKQTKHWKGAKQTINNKFEFKFDLWQIIIHNELWIVIVAITKINQFRWNTVIEICVHVVENILPYFITYFDLEFDLYDEL